MAFSTIDALRAQLGGGATTTLTPEYHAKMLHPFPPATAVDRATFLLEHTRGKRVLEFGASGPMHEGIKKVASAYTGVDRDWGEGVIGFDLDDVTQVDLPYPDEGVDVVICGEVLEHLSNPGHFLARLRKRHTGPVIITVPNAFAAAGAKWAAKGIENVNRDHVAWYSPKTLSVLLERAGYTVGALFWYGGTGPTAEGLIVTTE
jgi:2-polyprenyl-3-methyl-5-hydroxy-6-metoxy-1,4-benzoquinol methylase